MIISNNCIALVRERSDLIELVRNENPLWDQRDKNYHNRDMKPALWDKIGKTFVTANTFFCIPLHFCLRATHAPKLASSHKDRDKLFFCTI
jgi:hypothetical protein